jgi:hypothetical protein
VVIASQRSAKEWVPRLVDVTKSVIIVFYVLVMVGTIVGLDVVVFRNHFWARLLANVAIVLIFGAFSLRFHGALGVT